MGMTVTNNQILKFFFLRSQMLKVNQQFSLKMYKKCQNIQIHDFRMTSKFCAVPLYFSNVAQHLDLNLTKIEENLFSRYYYSRKFSGKVILRPIFHNFRLIFKITFLNISLG